MENRISQEVEPVPQVLNTHTPRPTLTIGVPHIAPEKQITIDQAISLISSVRDLFPLPHRSSFGE